MAFVVELKVIFVGRFQMLLLVFKENDFSMNCMVTLLGFERKILWNAREEIRNFSQS